MSNAPGLLAISVTQPWATLVAIGAKRLETRSWYTRYRGPLAIHATREIDVEACKEEPIKAALIAAGVRTRADLPTGRIVAVCEITGCFATPAAGSGWREYCGGFRLPPDEPERSFGDYGPGRYAWRLENVQWLAGPVPCRGARLLWLLPPDVLAAVQAQLAEGLLGRREEER